MLLSLKSVGTETSGASSESVGVCKVCCEVLQSTFRDI